MAITMPGMVAKDIDIQGIIKKLLKVKRGPIKRIEEEVDKLNEYKDIWKNIRKELAELGKLAKQLYDYTNPFDIKKAGFTDESSLKASANRKAARMKREIQVIQVAKGHRLGSDSLRKSKRLKGEKFTVSVGEKKAVINFSEGGTIVDLARLIRRHAKSFLNVIITYNTSKTAVVVLEAKDTGAGNMISFKNGKKLLKAAGFLKEGGGGSVLIDLNERGMLKEWSGAGNYPTVHRVQSGRLQLDSNARLERVLKKPVKKGRGLTLELEVRIDPIDEAADRQSPADNNKSGNKQQTNSAVGQSYDAGNVKLGVQQPLQIKDLKIWSTPLQAVENKPQQSGNSNTRPQGKKTDKPDDGKPQGTAAAKPDNKAVVLISTAGGTREEFKLEAAGALKKWKKLSVKLDKLEGFTAADRLGFINGNKKYRISYRNVKISEPARDGLTPKNEMQLPQDAVLMVDGVKVTRKKNTVSDLLDGVTLTLLKPGKKGDLQVGYDMDLINKYVYKFLEKYNKTIKYINAVTKFMTSEEKKKLAKELKSQSDLVKALEDKDKAMLKRHQGKLSGDMSLSRLKSRLGILMMSPYPTKLRRELALLSQLGISTGKVGATWSSLKENHGTIELDTDQLKKMMEKDVEAVRQMFGNDTDDDLRIDNGICYKIYHLVKVYTQAGNSGVIAVKLKSLDRQIDSKRKLMARRERSLKQYEQRLRRQFMNMEGRIKQYRDQSRWLNQGNQSGGGK